MPLLNQMFANLATLFVRQALLNNDAWKAIHKDRFYEDVRFPTNPKFPLGVVKEMPGAKPWLWSGVPGGYVGKVETDLHVYSVRQYKYGEGSWFDFDASYKALCQALCSVACVNVTFQDNIVGQVFVSRFIEKITMVDQQDDVEMLYHGIAIKVIHN